VIFPRLSMVCVTNRPEFADAVWTQFNGQTWPNKELVVIDSSEDGLILKDRADVHVRMDPDTWVGPLRNAGLKAARGSWLMWFDDDDWRHPDLSTILMDVAIRSSACIAGLRSYCWINLDGKMGRRDCGKWPVFGASVYRNFWDTPPFRDKPRCKTDSYWLPRMQERGVMSLVSQPELFVYVHHGSNVHNSDLGLKRDGKETDRQFLPGYSWGLAWHMYKIREGVKA